MATPSIGFPIAIAPPPELAAQPPTVRQEFWREVLRLALIQKDAELAAGLDRHGMPLHEIARSTRLNRRSAMGSASPNAPPLTPAYGLSRTRALLTGSATADGCRLTWKADPHWRPDPRKKGRGAQTPPSWGAILEYHRKGSSRLPVRDVIGLAPSRVESVKRQAWSYFYNKHLATATAPARRPVPRPSVAARIRSGTGALFRSIFGRRKPVVA